MRGRPRKPTVIKLYEGNRGHRPLPKNEPMPDIGVPACPKDLSAAAKEEWERITPLLLKVGVLSVLDTATLGLYCQAYARWQEAERKIQEAKDESGDGLVIKAPSGYPIQNPYLAIANRAMEDCHKYLQQLGLSPASRSRIVAQKKPDENRDGSSERFFAG